ncbi:2-(1,2-epoxy-1,2-dihydrophenyl)acetyl-CoA isomerase [Jeotgalibacillus sp. S-D1]|uniref:enoyl-CoA hydratase-related protein n=1 Tax=Jeotgalibacillus sp. S-D1 TaxID=2552189 RepID=UPI00105A60B5|nr:enoyl-CoA hydratase-related protein [Jeotgalibacillus sp. S-D1]TDL35270.1 2-(1,2-epoxy-1,2-dihydrophenyl)acetyl-CoA isomerase [Jeotgalibacillus sp. S-D1]
MEKAVQYEVSEGIARLTFNRSDKLNSFNEQMHTEMLLALKDANKNPDVRCLIITGNGRAFSAGEDLDGVTEDMDHGEVIRKRYAPVMIQLSKMKMPVIAAVNGIAAGSGFSLALACDFRLMHEKAKLVQAFIHVGLIPDSGNLYYLPKLIGHAKALELALFGEKINASQALDLGLATRVVAGENWHDEVNQFADRLALMPTKAVGIIKQQLQKSWEYPLEEFLDCESFSQRIAGLTSDHQEGVKAFREKRLPEFKGN